MPSQPIANISDLIGRRAAFAGLQNAHIIGQSFYTQLAWLQSLIGVDEEANFVVLPESERGSAILGVAAHFGSHNKAFDRFFIMALILRRNIYFN